MELLGIVLSAPVALVASLAYCFFLAKVIVRFLGLSRWMRAGSLVVLGVFVVELVLLVTLGAVRSRGLIGRGFYIVHLALFFLGTPALANVLVLGQRPAFLRRWYVAAAVCAVFAFSLVLLQYHVSEALYGVDGMGGPYGRPFEDL